MKVPFELSLLFVGGSSFPSTAQKSCQVVWNDPCQHRGGTYSCGERFSYIYGKTSSLKEAQQTVAVNDCPQECGILADFSCRDFLSGQFPDKNLPIGDGECSADIEDRVDCGIPNPTEDSCRKVNCCVDFNVEDGRPWCFAKTGFATIGPIFPDPSPVCDIGEDERKDCGIANPTEKSCLGAGCCVDFNVADGVPWCFRYKESSSKNSNPIDLPIYVANAALVIGAVELGLAVAGFIFGAESFLDPDEPKCSFDSIFPTNYYHDSLIMQEFESYFAAYSCKHKDCLTDLGRREIGNILEELGRKTDNFVRNLERNPLRYDHDVFYDEWDTKWTWNRRYFPSTARLCQIFHPETKSLLNRWASPVKPLEYLYCANNFNSRYLTPVLCNKNWQGYSLGKCPVKTATLNSNHPGGSRKFNEFFRQFISVDVMGYLGNRINHLNSMNEEIYTRHSSDCPSYECLLKGDVMGSLLGGKNICDKVDWDWSSRTTNDGYYPRG